MKATVNTSTPISTIKEEIATTVGKVITVKEFNRQHRLTNQYTGIVTAVYDSVFLLNITINNYKLNKSFAYVSFSVGDMKYEF